MVFDLGILTFQTCFDVYIMGIEKSFFTVATNLAIFYQKLATFSFEHLVTLVNNILISNTLILRDRSNSLRQNCFGKIIHFKHKRASLYNPNIVKRVNNKEASVLLAIL